MVRGCFLGKSHERKIYEKGKEMLIQYIIKYQTRNWSGGNEEVN